MKLNGRTTTLAATAALALATILGGAGRAAAEDQATLLRGACEVGLAMAGKGTLAPAAVEACHKAYLATFSPRDGRNKVAAMLSEKAKPDLDTLALASLIADSSIKRAPDEPWGHLARHDIARRLGDAELLAASRRALLPFAAKEGAVRAALDDEVGRPPIWVRLLRLLVFLGLAGTGLHAFAHRRRRTRPDANPTSSASASRPAVVLVVLFSLLVSSRASAAPGGTPTIPGMPAMKDGQISRFKIDDDHPEEAVKALAAASKNPLELGYLLQDLAARADEAHKAADHARAARYYHALGVAAPTPYGPRMECQALEAFGDIPKAMVACRELLTRQGAVVNDYVHFVELVLKNPQPLHELEPKELEGVIAHLEKEANIGTLPTVLRCKVAMRFEDRAGLEKCGAAMSAAPADDPTVISIKWGLAVRQNDKPGALRLVEQAQKAGVGPDGIAKMRETTNAMTMRAVRKAGVIGGVGLFGIVAAFLGLRLLSASRRRTTKQSPV